MISDNIVFERISTRREEDWSRPAVKLRHKRLEGGETGPLLVVGEVSFF